MCAKLRGPTLAVLMVVREDFYTNPEVGNEVRLHLPRSSGTLTAIGPQGYVTDVIFVTALLLDRSG
jgi:hypothetical protein